jgi:hypothetical protein
VFRIAQGEEPARVKGKFNLLFYFATAFGFDRNGVVFPWFTKVHEGS